jgi:hypothetical protein
MSQQETKQAKEQSWGSWGEEGLGGLVTQIPLPVLLPSIPRHQLWQALTTGEREILHHLARGFCFTAALNPASHRSFPLPHSPSWAMPPPQFTEGQTAAQDRAETCPKLHNGWLSEVTFIQSQVVWLQVLRAFSRHLLNKQMNGWMRKEWKHCWMWPYGSDNTMAVPGLRALLELPFQSLEQHFLCIFLSSLLFCIPLLTYWGPLIH